MPHVVIGTAGHIDHGKSSLVRALTGVDPDRLPEEKRRGITIDLGYAFLDNGCAIIDVPGHEKLIRNMVAGAATIDYAMLVVAVDDGIMPQTREHLQILQLLGVTAGVIVMTKADLADDEWRDLVVGQIRSVVSGTFLQNADIFCVDSLSGRGVLELKSYLDAQVASVAARSDHGVFRLPVDRVFTVKGRGAVVTGTILSGSVKRDARLCVLPGGFDVRVRQLESQQRESDSLSAGQRAALNLHGETDRLARGQTLCPPHSLRATRCVFVAVRLLSGMDPLKDRQRIRFLIGTQEVIGRVQPLNADGSPPAYAVMLLEEDVVAVWGDRFILRRYSPMETLGGGQILNPLAMPPKARLREQISREMAELDGASLGRALLSHLKHCGTHGVEWSALCAFFGADQAALSRILETDSEPRKVLSISQFAVLDSAYQDIRKVLQAQLVRLHKERPSNPAFSRSDLMASPLAGTPDEIVEHALQQLVADGLLAKDGPLYKLPKTGVTLSAGQQALVDKIQMALRTAGMAPPSAAALAGQFSAPPSEIEKTLVLMEKVGLCRRLGVDLFFDKSEFAAAIEKIRDVLAAGQSVGIADAVRLLNSSRKYVVPFLEYLDSQGLTARNGNVRVRGPRG